MMIKGKNKNKDKDTQPPSLDDTIKDSIAQGKSGVQKKARKKLYTKLALWGGGILFLVWAISALFALPKGGTGFGLCKVFVERQIRYPTELRYSYVQFLGSTIRMWYVHRDAYGQTQFDKMDCTFRPDDTYGMALEKVTINRRELDPEIIEGFNKSIPAILAYPPDLTYPQGLPNDIKDLKLDK